MQILQDYNAVFEKLKPLNCSVWRLWLFFFCVCVCAFCLHVFPSQGRGRVPSKYPHAGYVSRIGLRGSSVSMGAALTTKNTLRP